MKRIISRSLLILSVVLLALATVGLSPCGPARVEAQTPLWTDEVVYLTNLEREQAGLPPLKQNPLLAQAAQAHAEAMASGDFMEHDDPHAGTSAVDRIAAAGYAWSSAAENIGGGAPSPAEVVQGWMDSPGHRANILNPRYREIGVGYFFDGSDAFPEPDAPYEHYWVQDFGTDRDFYPIVVNNEAFSIQTPAVNLCIYGEGWAGEMRLRNDQEPFGGWQPFSATLAWELPAEEGLHTVAVELRSAQGEVRSASDDIYFLTEAPTVEVEVPPTDTPTPAATPTPEPAGDDVVTMEKRISPMRTLPGEEVEVTFTLSADSGYCGPEVVGKPLDAVLVIDHSSSMEGLLQTLFGLDLGLTSKLDNAKGASIAFVDEIAMDSDRVAVVQFDDTANLLQPLTHDPALVKDGIQAIYGGGGTRIDAGLQVAHAELAQNGRADAAPTIILLSDGQSDYFAAQQAADAAKAEGIRIISVGIGDDVDAALMPEIATTPADYYYSPDTTDLKDIYISIAQQIREFVSATDLRIRHAFDPSKIEVIPESVSNGGELTGGTAKNVILWRLAELGDAPRTLTYRARVRQPGEFLVDIGEQVEYMVCESEARAFTGSAGLWLQVAEPTPTPMPTFTPTTTPTPTPAATATPTPTPTPAGAQIIPEEPTPTPSLLDRLPQPTRAAFCSSRYWWIPALLLPLGLVLLLLLLLWWWSRRNAVAWYNLWRDWHLACKIMSVLLLLYLLLLAFLIGREVFVGLCERTEAVYFWRMDPAQGDFGIFLTSQEEDAQPVPFVSVNREGCVGCHAVSSASHRIGAVVGPIPGRAVIHTLSGEKVDIPDIDAVYYGWSPNGEQVAISDSSADIYILELASGSLTPLSGASDPQVTEIMPAWSSDGETIAFVRSSTPPGTAGASVEGPCDIYTVPASGGVAQPLPGASGDGFNYYPTYSPDGRWLAFTRHTTGFTTYSDGAAEIFLVPADGGERIRLAANDAHDGTPLENVSNSWPTWSRKGEWLAFNSKRDDPAFDVFVARIDGEGNSGPAIPLPGAAYAGVFEHTPFWGDPLLPLPLWRRLLNLWPLLIPLPLLLLLRWLLCRRKKEGRVPPPPPGTRPPSRDGLVVAAWRPKPPEWDPAPTLVIGLGGTGRWVLTHLKKNLLDAAGAGEWRDEVRLLLLDNAPQEIVQGQEVAVQIGGVSLSDDEQLNVGRDLRELIRRMASDPEVESEMQAWFPASEYTRVRNLPDAQMDVRRTTHQRRPMGRAVVFQDVHQGEGSRLWQTLTRAVHQAFHEEEARVIIVGSLVGGFGSGALADVAYLVRRAGELGIAGTSAVITAFLATDNAYVQHTRSPQLKLNGMATLRELGRLQLARGRPFPMVYNQGLQDKAFSGYIEWSLFDDVFLFDGQRHQHPLTLYKPEEAMFPLMADLITSFVDRGSRLVEEVRANLRTESATAQTESGEPVVSALGAYTYRLPLRDLVRGLKLRFARDLLVLYLAGPDFAGQLDQLSSELCRDEYPDGLDALVEHFLRGTMDWRSGQMVSEKLRQGVGGLSAWVADLAWGRAVPDAALRNLTTAEAKGHLPHFREVLQATLLRLLNGHPADAVEVARSGKLGYALEFLDRLAHKLLDARVRAEDRQSRVQGEARPGLLALIELIKQEEAIVSQAQQDVIAAKDALLGSKDTPTARRQGTQRGLLSTLQERLAQEHRHREELVQVPVRRTLADEDDFERLYEDYFAPHLMNVGLESLHWQEDDQGRLRLSLVLEGEDSDQRVVRLSAEEQDMDSFLHALTDLGESAGQDVWDSRLDPFFDDEQRGLWQDERLLRQEASKARSWAEPVTIARTGMAQEQQPYRYLWVNRTVQSRQAFADQVQLEANQRDPVQVLRATDPYSATLITSLDILPLRALACTERLDTVYRNMHGLGDAPGSREGLRLPEPVHVFAAERHALAYEQRLHELREPPRLFHPLFVAALEDLERARLFTLAYALRWIPHSRFQERGVHMERYVLDLPDAAEAIPLTRGDQPKDPVALLVRAMQGFVLGHPEMDLVQTHYSSRVLAQLVSEALRQHLSNEIDSLRAFVENKSQDLVRDARIGVDDFWSFARLVVYDELEALR